MKKLTYLLFLAIGVTACSVESMDSTENLLTADLKAKVNATSSTEMLFEENVCAGEETVITVNFPQRKNPQGKNLPTTVKIELMVEGSWLNIYEEELNDVTTTSFNYTFNDAMEYELRYSAETGPWNDSQFLEVSDCCTEGFTYIDNGDRTYTFTYKAGEDMDNAKLVFTFAQGAYVSGLSVDFSQNGNGHTYEAIMDLEKCDVLEYTVTLSPTCTGANNSSNVWTDFKVNEVSQKANIEDKFTASCN